MNLNAHLMFNGQCKAAFEYYERCFGGKIITMMTWGDSPMKDQAPEGAHDKILHATLRIGDNVLLGADAPKDDVKKDKEKLQGTWKAVAAQQRGESQDDAEEQPEHDQLQQRRDEVPREPKD